jgi:hypothetical protein
MLLVLLLFLDYNPNTLVPPPFKHSFGFYRASKYYLQLFLGPGYDYDDPQGIVAVKLRELDDPSTKKDDDELSVFAINSGRGQVVYNVGLEAVKTYGSSKVFTDPKGITATEDGVIAVADFGNKRVVKLQYSNGKLEPVSEIVLPGRPYDVCFDSENYLYITDYDNACVYIYDPMNTLAMKFGIEGRSLGELSRPMGIEVIDAGAPHNHYHDDFIVVTDRDGLRISKFSKRGQFLGSVQNTDIGLADARFLYVAIDYFGSVYVTDEINDQIHKFDHDLRYIISVGRTGTSKGEFVAPRGITIWRRYGQVFLSEREGGQYLWIGADAFVIGCFPERFTPSQPGSTLAIYMTQDSKLYITIYNSLGEKVRDLVQGIQREPGEFLIVWDGLDDNGVVVPAGDYQIYILLKSLHGLARRIEKELRVGITCAAS